MIGAALAAASCAKSELSVPQPATDSADGGSGVTMTVIPSVDEVKTTIVDNMDGTFSPLWSTGDAISMSFSAAGAAKFQDFNKKLVSASAATAEKTTFSGIIYAPAKSGDYSFYAIYPQGSVKEGSAPDGIIVDLPQSQIVPTASFDPKADILFGQKKTIKDNKYHEHCKGSEKRWNTFRPHRGPGPHQSGPGRKHCPGYRP